MTEPARTVAERILRAVAQSARDTETGELILSRAIDPVMPILTAYAAEIWEAAAKEAEACSLIGAHPIGPLAGVGWAQAQSAIAAALRAHAVSRQEPK